MADIDAEIKIDFSLPLNCVRISIYCLASRMHTTIQYIIMHNMQYIYKYLWSIYFKFMTSQ